MKAVSPLFEQLNKSWEEIEKFFRKQGILTDVAHRFDDICDWYNGQEVPIGARLIGIQKHKGKWRICYGVEYDNGPPDMDIDWTPVTDCGTSVRIELLDHVAALFEKLVKANEDFVPEVEQAVAKSQSVLAELGLSEL